ncbi:hypothetical protein RAS1_12230 [Phycisphaerae bacterium RAS1]|nr:hypothetical protein RAS1_12230 [Phycisphaerae bacterium RAS1]
MSFLNLWAFAIAGAVIPTLLILYFLKLRRREEVVPSTLLWKKAIQDLQVNAPFQKLRKNLLLFLQLLILSAAITALARPIVQTNESQDERVVLLIDRSASMNTREGDHTRFELAREQAIRRVKTYNRRSSGWFSFVGGQAPTKVMVIAFADRARVVAPFTVNTNELVELIRGVEPSDARTNLREALELAEAYMLPPSMTTDKTPVATEAPARLLMFSDGCVPGMNELVLRGGTMEWVRIGDATDNVGITALRTQRSYEEPELLDVFLQVENFGATPVQTDVSIHINGQLSQGRVRTVSLGPAAPRRDVGAETRPEPGADAGQGASRTISFELTVDEAAVLEARLSRTDALAVDNSAWAVIPPPRKLKVLVASAGNPFIESVLAGLPLEKRVFVRPDEYEKMPAAELEADGRAVYDLIVLDKHSTARLPAGNYLFLGAAPQISGVQLGEEFGPHPLIWWDETHAVLRHVLLDYVVVFKSRVLTAPPESQVLVEGPRGPVMVRYANEGRHFLICSAAVENTNWWRKRSFGVFMHNATRYLGSGGAEESQSGVHPGDTLMLTVPAGTQEAKLIRPDAATPRVRVDADGGMRYSDTERVGVYRVEPGVSGRDRAAVNIEDRRESDIVPPGGVLKLGGGVQVAQAQQIRTSTPEVWRWFIGLALAVVLLEWYIYNRRVMI